MIHSCLHKRDRIANTLNAMSPYIVGVPLKWKLCLSLPVLLFIHPLHGLYEGNSGWFDRLMVTVSHVSLSIIFICACTSFGCQVRETKSPACQVPTTKSVCEGFLYY